jgi:uncharacterized membrane protein
LLPALFIIAANALLALRLGAGVSPVELWLGGGLSLASGLAGTILGWIALSDIRAQNGRVRGLALAAFGGLAWPVILLFAAAVFAASPFVYYLRSGPNAQMPLAALLVMVVAAGLVTFAVWMVYATTRWASGKAASQRGVLRWIFVALVLFGGAVLFASVARKSTRPQATDELEAAQTTTETNAWVRFTFTAVEFRRRGETLAGF